MNKRTPRTAIKAAAFLSMMLLPGFVRGQQQNASDKRTVQPAPVKALSPEDAEIQRLKDERQRLLKQKEIEKLRKENEQLENGTDKPATPQAAAPSPKALSPEDAELQRLEEERKRLLKEQEIEKLRKQPVQPPAVPPVQTQKPQANCTPQAQQGPSVKAQIPPKASAWTCKTLGICPDNKPVVLNPADNGCPSAPAK
jgi:hypothetical protein